MSGATILQGDNSWLCMLSTETKPTNTSNKSILLEVDTGTWYVFYEGTWYAQ